MVCDDVDSRHTIKRVEHRRIRARHINYGVFIHRRCEVDYLLNGCPVERFAGSLGRGQQIRAWRHLNDKVSEEHVIKTMRVLQRIGDGKSRFGPGEQRSVTTRSLEIYQEGSRRLA